MFLERAGTTLMLFLVTLLLARILSPEEYGVVSVALVFINLANVFVTHGLNASLIQRTEVGDVEYSTAFYATLAMTSLIYLGIFAGAPFVGSYLDNQAVVPILRVLALRLPISAFNSIQRAYVSRELQFRKFFYVTLVGTIAGAVVGIGMALTGFGAWSIVGQYLAEAIARTLTLFLMINWRPKLLFSFRKLKEMIGFSWKVFLAAFFSEAYQEIRSFAIGGKYSEADLAYFNRGKQFPQMFFINISSPITSVMFPVMSKQQDDLPRLKNSLTRTIQMVAYVLFPIMVGMAAVARPLIVVLLTEKWLPSVLFLQIFCYHFALLPIQSIHEQVYKALGRSDIMLKLFFVEKTLGIIVVLLTMQISVEAIAWGMVFSATFDTLFHVAFARKTVGFSYLDLVKTIGNTLLCCGVMLAAVLAVGLIPMPVLLKLVVQVLVGMAVYVFCSVLTKSRAMKYLLQIINGKVHLSILKKLEARL